MDPETARLRVKTEGQTIQYPVETVVTDWGFRSWNWQGDSFPVGHRGYVAQLTAMSHTHDLQNYDSVYFGSHKLHRLANFVLGETGIDFSHLRSPNLTRMPTMWSLKPASCAYTKMSHVLILPEDGRLRRS